MTGPRVTSSPLVVLFDGGCPMCRRTVRMLRRLDWLGRLRYADVTDPATRARLAPDLDDAAVMQQMYVLDAAGLRAGGYDAQLWIAGKLPLLWPLSVLGRLPGIRHAGRVIYRYIAANRQRSGSCTDDLCSPEYRRTSPPGPATPAT